MPGCPDLLPATILRKKKKAAKQSVVYAIQLAILAQEPLGMGDSALWRGPFRRMTQGSIIIL